MEVGRRRGPCLLGLPTSNVSRNVHASDRPQSTQSSSQNPKVMILCDQKVLPCPIHQFFSKYPGWEASLPSFSTPVKVNEQNVLWSICWDDEVGCPQITSPAAPASWKSCTSWVRSCSHFAQCFGAYFMWLSGSCFINSITTTCHPPGTVP